MVDENKVLLKEIEKYAKENKVPIMQKDGIKFLTNYVQEQGVKSILEVGTAIGYSAICMALVDPKIKITTIEKNLEKHGTIITDNIFFHGYTYMDPEKIESRNVRGIARKIRDYVSFLEENDSYETVIKKIGDGIAVTRRK